MPRPCECGNARPGNYEPGDCMPCWKWINSPWWRERWTTGEPSRPEPAPTPLPCVHEGDAVPAGEVAAVGLSPARRWHRCQAGVSLGGNVPDGWACRCRGCGPQCEQYEPDHG